jgi:hypothetical protein
MLKKTVWFVIAGAVMVGFLYDRFVEPHIAKVQPEYGLFVPDVRAFYEIPTPVSSFAIPASRPVADSTLSAVVPVLAREIVHSTGSVAVPTPAAFTGKDGLQAPQLATAQKKLRLYGVYPAFGHTEEGGGCFGTDSEG